MLLLLQGTPTFEMDALTKEVLQQGVAFIETDITRFAMGVFFLCFFFHLIEGAMELFQNASSCRLFKLTFWMRIFFTLTLLIGYKAIVVNTAEKVMPNYMVSLGTQWGNMFDNQIDSAKEIKDKAVQDKEVKDAQLEQKQGSNDDSWWAKAAKYVVDGILTALGYILGIIAGLLITCLVLFEGFMVLGVVTLLIAFGPLCVAFLAHERTEGFFWSFFKTWLVYGLLYIPALNLGVAMAGIVLKHMSSFMAGGTAVSGDWSDIGIHFVLVFIGPFCAYAMVRSVSTFLSIVFSTGAIGSGHAAFEAGAAAVGAGVGGSIASSQGKDQAAASEAKHDAQHQEIIQAISGSQSGSGSSGHGSGSDVRGE